MRASDGGGFLHVFRFSPAAVAVPAAGQRSGEPYRLGSWCCVMCRVLLDFTVAFGLDHGNDCPGRVVPACNGAGGVPGG